MPSLERLLNGFTRRIKIQSDNLKIISRPNEFRDELLYLSSKVSKKVYISALYFGNSPSEHEIARNLSTAVDSRNCDVNIVLDYHRGTRDGGEGLKAMRKKGSLCLYRTPHFRRVRYIPNQVGEFIGVHHMKYYSFDDETIISGANLSKLYFDKRQDRYYAITSAHFANFIRYLYELYSASAQPWQPMSQISRISKPTGWNETTFVTAQYHCDKFACNTPMDNNFSRDLGNDGDDTSVFPLFQIGWHHVNQIEDALELILQRAKSGEEVTISSGYFNPTKTILECIKSSKAIITIIIPSLEANGFYNGTFLKQFVPDMYNLIAFRALLKCPNVNIMEYNRDGWSFHAKGVWYKNFTLIGSSNLSYRSLRRDSELSVGIITKNDELANQFVEEKNDILQYCRPFEKKYRLVSPLGHFFISSYL